MKIFSEEEDDDDAMSVIDFSRVKNRKDKLKYKELCPVCGSSNTEKKKHYWRCLNDDCDTLTYIPTDYELNIGEM